MLNIVFSDTREIFISDYLLKLLQYNLACIKHQRPHQNRKLLSLNECSERERKISFLIRQTRT